MNISILNTIVGIVGIIVCIAGIIVGIIGYKSIRMVTRIKNKTKAGDNASIQNAQVINNGLDSYAVIRLSKETTHEELIKIIDRIESVETTVGDMPRIYTSDEEPKNARDGDVWIKP